MTQMGIIPKYFFSVGIKLLVSKPQMFQHLTFWEVHVLADAVSSQRPLDREVALDRLRQAVTSKFEVEMARKKHMQKA